jgi:tetratricopeptide (TPR) repeat protein
MRSARLLFGLVLAAALMARPTICAGTRQDESTESRIEALWRAASAAQQEQQYSRAARLYQQILALHPALIEAEVNLGLMYQLTGDLHAAIFCFRRALTRSPELYAPNLMLGLDYLKLGRPKAALPYLQRALAARPNDTKARVGLANSYLQLRQYTEAQKNFSRVIELDSKNADAWYGLGATYLSIEKEAEAKIGRSSSPLAGVLLGESYLQQGRSGKAVKVLKPIVDASPAAPCARSLLGFAYLRDAKLEDAALQFQLDWNAQRETGCLLAKLGLVALDADRADTDAALRELREAVDIDAQFVRNHTEFFWNDLVKAGMETKESRIMAQHGPDELPPAVPKLAGSYLNKGQYSACSAALAAAPSTLIPQQLRLLARCSCYVGHDDLVMEATDLLLKAHPDDPEALYWRIESVGRLGLAALTEATEINPDSISLHVLSGDMLRGKGDFTKAAAEYRKALALNPDFLAAHMGLARDLYSDDDREGTEHELQYVLNVNPSDPEANYLMGEILVSRRQFAAALPFLLKGLHAAPEELPEVHASLSKVYAEHGELARAISEIKQALPGDVDGSYHYRLGRLYLQAGDRAAAAQAMQQSAKLRRRNDASTSLEGEQ